MNFADVEKAEWASAETAQSYADAFAPAADMCVPGLVAACGDGRDVLDLCCGHGNVTRGLTGAGKRATGLDFSPAMLALARTRAPAARFVEGDAMNLPFEDGSFDAVTIGFGMPHVPDPTRVLGECGRVLRPGGRLAYTVWHGAERESALVAVFGAIAAHGDKEVSLPPGPGANDYAQPDIAFPALEAAGFGGFNLDTVNSHWVVDDAAAPYDYFAQGTARGGNLLRRQPPERQAAIRATVVEWVETHCGAGPPWQVPIPAALVTARKV